MDPYLLEALKQALHLIGTLDREMLRIVAVSLKVCVASTLLASVAGIPLGVGVSMADFRGKRLMVNVLNTLMALPTVVVGLFVYGLLSRQGPFGSLGLLYTPWAMVIGQTLLIIPLIAALSYAAIQSVDPGVAETALTLGANRWQSVQVVIAEGREALLAAVVAGFGRVFAEVGISMMVGGNIRGYTRNITTAIALETSKGEFALGLALGLILLAVAFGINAALQVLRRRTEG